MSSAAANSGKTYGNYVPYIYSVFYSTVDPVETVDTVDTVDPVHPVDTVWSSNALNRSTQMGACCCIFDES